MAMLPHQVTIDENIMDIQELRATGTKGYTDYLREQIFFVDHHGIFRSLLGEYPIVTTAEQLDALIKYLNSGEVRGRLEE